MMNCPSCGHQNPADADFCEECAAELARVCAGCGTTNAPTAKFCKRCRASLTATANATSPASRTPTPAPSPALPTAFAGGRYQVQRFLGEVDAKLDRDVAIAVEPSISLNMMVTVPSGAACGRRSGLSA